jgi:hypothetical protein
VICRAETWNEIEDYWKAKKEWLRQYLQLPNRIPSHNTFNRFFSALDPESFEQAFLLWIRTVSSLTEGEVVNIDEKTFRGSREVDRKPTIHIVSAWPNTNQLIL